MKCQIMFSGKIRKNITGIDISCKLSPMETICMKCQILFSGENKKNINLSSAEFIAKGVVQINPCSQATHKRVIGKQCRLRSAAAEHGI